MTRAPTDVRLALSVRWKPACSLLLMLGVAACVPPPVAQTASSSATGPASYPQSPYPMSSPPNALPPLMDWRNTVMIEDSDRENRFLRLAAAGHIGSPQFYRYLISAKDLPPGFGVDVPVLRVVFPERVFFDTGSAEISPDAQPILQLIANTLGSDVPDVAVFVAGHTDSRGGDEYNYQLSVDRANAVAQALLQMGAGQTYHFWEIGFGKTVPLVPNTTPENMAENRRVELLIAARPEAIAQYLAQFPAMRCGQVPNDMQADCLSAVASLPSPVAVPVSLESTTAPAPPPPVVAPALTPPVEAPAPFAAPEQAIKGPVPEGQIIQAPPGGTTAQFDPGVTYTIQMNVAHYTVGAPKT